MVNAREALNKATAILKQEDIDSPRVEAELLLENASGLQRIQLYLDDQPTLSSANEQVFWQAIRARSEGLPIQYILKSQPFRYLNLSVVPGVFIPRPETELLVEYTISAVRKSFRDSEPITFIDVGTGTGAIALSLVHELPNASGWAVDTCKTALDVACENAKENGLGDRVNFIKSSYFSDLDCNLHGRVDLVISNPPYVCRDEISNLQTEVKDFEPYQALDGGVDGLQFYREIIASSPLFLRKGGILALEIGKDQAGEVANLIDKNGSFPCADIYEDYAGFNRVIITRRA